MVDNTSMKNIQDTRGKTQDSIDKLLGRSDKKVALKHAKRLERARPEYAERTERFLSACNEALYALYCHNRDAGNAKGNGWFRSYRATNREMRRRGTDTGPASFKTVARAVMESLAGHEEALEIAKACYGQTVYDYMVEPDASADLNALMADEICPSWLREHRKLYGHS